VADYSAIAPGTDLARYARELMRMHETLIGGGRPELQPRPLVSRSWQRVLGFGLIPDRQGSRDPVSPARLEELRRTSPLRLVIDDLARVVSSVADASHFLMVVTDGDGIILWRRGDTKVRRRADELGFSEGARWTENEVGTNAIGTALEEASPVQLFSGEHFEQAQHSWYCTAFPIHDPRTGELLGIVDISGPALTLHPAISALVETAVLLAESLLRRHHQAALEKLRIAAEPIVSAAGGPALVVDEAGWVAHSAGVSTRDRIAVPESDRAVAVPGLGLCMPQRLDLGWLIRPSTTQRRIVAQLHLGHRPVVEIRGDAEPWRIALSRRHAQILRALGAAGREGLTPYALSVELFGDGEHTVAARAEVSRLRKTLGAIVDSRPYRIADGVQLTVGP
jgi:hypothetical protein